MVHTMVLVEELYRHREKVLDNRCRERITCLGDLETALIRRRNGDPSTLGTLLNSPDAESNLSTLPADGMGL